MPRTKKTAAETAPPENKLALSDDQRRALHLQHYRKIVRLNTQIDALTGERRSAYAAAKAELGDGAKDDIKAAIELNSLQGDKKLRARLDRLQRIAAWHNAGIGQQLSLLAIVPKRDHFEDGKTAGLAGDDPKAPDGLGQADTQKWMEGWHAGQAVLAEGFGRSKVADESAPAPGEGEAAGKEGASFADKMGAKNAEVDEALKRQAERMGEGKPPIGDKPASTRKLQ